ncbi:hypothetical protein M8J75_008022 [Diaphorina citri]|nr:hypothetical protein M8J75_008022 [Diaphorina citri]
MVFKSPLIFLFYVIMISSYGFNLSQSAIPDGISGECKKTEFRCNNGRCIPQAWVCEGEDDCKDNSDETAKECHEMQTVFVRIVLRKEQRCNNFSELFAGLQDFPVVNKMEEEGQEAWSHPGEEEKVVWEGGRISGRSSGERGGGGNSPKKRLALLNGSEK